MSGLAGQEAKFHPLKVFVINKSIIEHSVIPKEVSASLPGLQVPGSARRSRELEMTCQIVAGTEKHRKLISSKSTVCKTTVSVFGTEISPKCGIRLMKKTSVLLVFLL